MRRSFTCIFALALLAGCGESASRQPAVGSTPAPAPAATASAVIAPPAAVVATAAPTVALSHLAVGTKVTVSSTHTEAEGEGSAANLVDGNPLTRWSSDYADNQEVTIDLGQAHALASLRLLWEVAAAKTSAVQTSLDGSTWSAPIENANGGQGPRAEDVALAGVKARFIKLVLKERASEWGFSLYEIAVNEAK